MNSQNPSVKGQISQSIIICCSGDAPTDY